MKMHHLCRAHCAMVQRNSKQAMQLWLGAFNSGVQAFEKEHWQEAKRFLGTAYEISLLRFVEENETAQFTLTAEQMGALGRYYSNTLCQLEEYEAAESCLRRVHDGLLHWAQEGRLPRQERIQAYEQLAEFRERTAALLSLTGRETYAKCLRLMALQVSRQAAQGLFH